VEELQERGIHHHHRQVEEEEMMEEDHRKMILTLMEHPELDFNATWRI
jgi:hypothetical protein